MAEAQGECPNLHINNLAAAVPTEIPSSADIGDMPEVDEAPAVIGGKTQSE